MHCCQVDAYVSVINVGEAIFDGAITLRVSIPQRTDQFGTHVADEIVTIEKTVQLRSGERTEPENLGYLNAPGNIREFTLLVDVGASADCNLNNNQAVFSASHVRCR